ncbi:hypothetical protein EOPP23_17535 [Endozoicomonas sp. OPT23]|uniref:hypothetical protein n=1 Tax=Endozoicomonas sp. OPT23 TaxID=2072845 RepID=UPI00129BBB87|nr:hypothetical protein [Endozoicomonas sp. OPT23]MRI34786.1 hypothetical protein [Endozoicomonas sp. OPT23]
MDARRLLLLHGKHLGLSLKKLGLKASVISQTDHGIVLGTRLQLRPHMSMPCYCTLSSGVSDGQSLIITCTAVIDTTLSDIESLPALAAFINQLSTVIPQFSLLLDLDSRKLILRQSQLYSKDSLCHFQVFYDKVQLLALPLINTVTRICKSAPSVTDARLMADYLAEDLYTEVTA